MEAWEEKKGRAVEILMALTARLRQSVSSADIPKMNLHLKERGKVLDEILECDKNLKTRKTKMDETWLKQLQHIQSIDKEMIQSLESQKNLVRREINFLGRLKTQMFRTSGTKGMRVEAKG